MKKSRLAKSVRREAHPDKVILVFLSTFFGNFVFPFPVKLVNFSFPESKALEILAKAVIVQTPHTSGSANAPSHELQPYSPTCSISLGPLQDTGWELC